MINTRHTRIPLIKNELDGVLNAGDVEFRATLISCK